MDLRDLIALARPYRGQLALLAALSILGTLVMLAIPALGARLIGGMFDAASRSTELVAALLVAAVVLTALVNVFNALWAGKVSARILADQRQRIYRHVQALPIGWHENHRQGDTLALMTWEVASLATFLTATLASVPARLVMAAGAVAIMFTIDPLLASLVPVAVPLFYLILKVIGRRLRGLAMRIRAAEAEVLAVAEENLEMLPAIKSFAREEREASRYGHAVDVAMDLALRENRIKAMIGPTIELIAAIAAVALLIVAGRSMAGGALSPTELFGFLFYAALLTRPVSALSNIYGEVQTARGTLSRLNEVMTNAPEAGYAAAGRMDRACGGSLCAA